jgi:hypothetical protein
VDITANRPDAMNHLGLAREIAAALGRALRAPAFDLTEDAAPAAGLATVAIEAPELCARYVGRVVTGLRVGPSPAWLRRRLEAIGLDLQEQPRGRLQLRALRAGPAAARLRPGPSHGARRGRAARARRRDDRDRRRPVEKKLEAGMLVIAEAGEPGRRGRPAAIAGVMGGFDSAISDATTDVLVESAWFDPRSVARTSRTLALRTDASQRFERGADPGMTLFAADRLAALLAELGGGRVLAGAIDARAPGIAAPTPGRSEEAAAGATAGPPPPWTRVRRAGAPGRAQGLHGRPSIRAHHPQPTARLLAARPRDRRADRLAAPRATVDRHDARGGRGAGLLRAELARRHHARGRSRGGVRPPGRLRRHPVHAAVMAPPLPREGSGEAEDRARRALAGCGYREIITYSMLPRAEDERFGPLSTRPRLRPRSPLS